MTDHDPEHEPDEPTVADEPDPEEFEPEGETSVSTATGTVYEGEGEPAETPHDAALTDEVTEELAE